MIAETSRCSPDADLVRAHTLPGRPVNHRGRFGRSSRIHERDHVLLAHDEHTLKDVRTAKTGAAGRPMKQNQNVVCSVCLAGLLAARRRLLEAAASPLQTRPRCLLRLPSPREEVGAGATLACLEGGGCYGGLRNSHRHLARCRLH